MAGFFCFTALNTRKCLQYCAYTAKGSKISETFVHLLRLATSLSATLRDVLNKIKYGTIREIRQRKSRRTNSPAFSSNRVRSYFFFFGAAFFFATATFFFGAAFFVAATSAPPFMEK